MKNIEKKYGLIKLANGDYQLQISVVPHIPDIKAYIKNQGNYIGIYDGGTTLSALFLIKNLSSKVFEQELHKICKNKKISKQGSVFFLETYEKDFDTRLQDFITAINEICLIKN